MQGTEKQIKWAEDIKAEAIRNCNARIAASEAVGMDQLENELYRIMIDAIEAIFDKVDDAAKIINKREMFYFETIQTNIRRAATLIRRGNLTVEQFAKANGVNR